MLEHDLSLNSLNAEINAYSGIAAVILAAGESSRMARQKLTLDWGGLTIIQRVVGCVLAAGIRNIFIVLGHEGRKGSEAVRGSIQEYISRLEGVKSKPKIIYVNNPDPSRGMASSFAEAVKVLRPWERWKAVLMALGDQPEVQAGVIRLLIEKFITSSEKYKVVQPIFRGKKGHPILMATEVLPGVLELRPDQQLRELFWPWSEQRLYVEVADQGILIDIDTDEDYLAHRPE